MKEEMEKKMDKGGVVIYKEGARVRLSVRLEKETVWLTQAQVASLFGSERSVITKHLNNIFSSLELDEESNVQKMHIPNSDKPVKFYSLDVIISVGYRVNSKRATQFRIWATRTLKDYLVKGYAINEKRLLEAGSKFEQLKNTVAFLQDKSKKELLRGQETEILDLLADYAKTLSILDKYDEGAIKQVQGRKAKFILSYEVCEKVIVEIKRELFAKKEASDFFGKQPGKTLEGIIKGIYQTFDGKELYETLEVKAAHLLYLVIKDHPFIDGNKRIGSFLFTYFLDKNEALWRENGARRIDDNALVALALLVAESAPKEKEQMVALITQLLS